MHMNMLFRVLGLVPLCETRGSQNLQNNKNPGTLGHLRPFLNLNSRRFSQHFTVEVNCFLVSFINVCSSFPSLSFRDHLKKCFVRCPGIVFPVATKVKGLLEDLAARHTGDMQTHLAFHRHRHLGQGIHGNGELRGVTNVLPDRKECKGTAHTQIYDICIYMHLYIHN